MATRKKKEPVIKLKPGYEKAKIAFGSSAKPLGERDDLLDLLIPARMAEDNFILRMFDNPPTLEELAGMKMARAMAAATEELASDVTGESAPEETPIQNTDGTTEQTQEP